eukprot:gene48509-65820_t
MEEFDNALHELLARHTPTVADCARNLIGLLLDIRPDFSVKVASGWGTVNFSHPNAGFVCAVFPGAEHVSLIFQQGKLLDS